MAVTLEEFLEDNPDIRDTWAYLESVLAQYGLSSLSTFAREQITEGRSEAEIVQRIRTTDEWKTRFKAIVEREAKGLPPMAESEVLEYEAQATQLMRSVGLPEGFYDTSEDFSKFLVSDVSLQELNQRVNEGYLAAMNSPVEVREELERQYGISPGQLTAYFLDENRTMDLLTRQFTSSQISAASRRGGYGMLSLKEAEDLTAQGISPQEAQAGFKDLSNAQELFGSLPGQNEEEITREEQLAATLGGNVQAEQKLQRKVRGRQAVFEAGGSFAANKEGFSGIGTSNSKK